MDGKQLRIVFENYGCFDDKKKTRKRLFSNATFENFNTNEVGNRLNSGWKTAQFIIVDKCDSDKKSVLIDNWKKLAENYDDQFLLVNQDNKKYYIYDGKGKFIGDDSKLIDLLNKKSVLNYCADISESDVNISQKRINDLNTILYGAPGTGKTYATPEYALAMIENVKHEEICEKYKNNRKDLLKKFEEYKEKGQIVFTTFHQSYGYEEFIQGLRPDTNSPEIKFIKSDGIFKTLADRASKPDNKKKKYVMIIDEINRGNISKIFGELITLVEESKRWGEPEQLSAILPSGDEFKVPNNLYILGTMNSADKSISLVDAALRRRFNFIEMCPDSSLVNIEFRKFLDAINTYLIKELRSKDLLIGHSYFINKEVEDFDKIVNQNIIPLLYEYFFDDELKIKKALDSVNIPLYVDSNNDEWVFEAINNPTGRIKYKVVKKKAASVGENNG